MPDPLAPAVAPVLRRPRPRGSSPSPGRVARRGRPPAPMRYGSRMIDHVGIAVADLQRSIAFYEKALAPLGYTLVMTWQQYAGFGVGGKPEFWIEGMKPPTESVHVAFRTTSRSIVRAFHTAALAAGGLDNGGPGIREIYHPDYFGAFVRDPDGHNVEAVCHEAYLGG
jgi:catechol 2,3-dioxygenase-like lactoylglutathione lyase family enzyme